MEVYLDGLLQGETNFIKISHKSDTSANVPEVAVLYSSGFVRLKQNRDTSPPVPFGSSAVLGPAYWSDINTYHHNPHIQRIEIDSTGFSSGFVSIRAIGTNHDFAVNYDMTLTPADEQTRLHVVQTYTATAPVSVHPDRLTLFEGFKIAQISTMYISEGSPCDGGFSDCHDSNAAAYVGQDAGYVEIFFRDLISPTYIFSSTQAMADTFLDALHTDDEGWQGNTPQIRVDLDRLPTEHTLTAQGWISPTTNPSNENVGVWIHDDSPDVAVWEVGESSQVSYTIIAQDNPFNSVCPTKPNSVCVIDEDGTPLSGASVYHDGSLAGQTDRDGVLVLTKTLQADDQLTALHLAYEQPTNKGFHAPTSDGNFAFRIYRTNAQVQNDGNLVFPKASSGNQQYTLQVRPDNTLVLYNLVVSIEGDASGQYVAELIDGLLKASDVLYDATDGQMAFGWLTIYESTQQWDDADIQIRDHNATTPQAFVGGINTSDSKYRIIYKGFDPDPGKIILGRYWNGSNAATGSWAENDGFKTIAHEFGHYGLFLFDEYFYYAEEGNDHLRMRSWCANDQSMPASIMNNQATKTEFCNRVEHYPQYHGGPPTYQTQRYGADETSWGTIQGVYSNTLQQMHPGNPPWTIRAPLDRNLDTEFLVGPAKYPLTVQIDNRTEDTDVLASKLVTITVREQPYWGALTVLDRQTGRPVDQGITDISGQIEVLGAHLGDRVCARTIDNGYSGCLTIAHSDAEILAISPVTNRQQQRSAYRSELQDVAPVVRAIPDSNGTTMRYFADMAKLGTEITAEIRGPYGLTETAKTMVYNDEMRHYFTEVEGFPAETDLIGLTMLLSPAITGTVFDEIGIAHHRSWTDGNADLNLTTPDGNLALNAPRGNLSFPIYVAANSTYALPGPPDVGKAVIGEAYSILSSGVITEWEQSMALTLAYHDVSLGDVEETSLRPYYWSASTNKWIPVETFTIDQEHQQVSASIRLFGIYALMGDVPAASISDISPIKASNDVTTILTITGTGFLSSTQIRVGDDVTLANITLVSSTVVKGDIPIGLPLGSYDVTVMNPNEQPVTLPNAFSVILPPPTIIAVSPDSATNDITSTLTITGAGFLSSTQIRLGDDVTLLNITLVSSTVVKGDIPIGLPLGSYDVTVMNPNEQPVTLPNAFSVILPPPTITAVSPGSISNDVTTTLTITGTGFFSATQIRLGDDVTLTNITLVSSTVVKGDIPIGLPFGSYGVTVMNPNEQPVTLPNAFSVILPPPTIIAVFPGSVTNDVTTTLTITGTGFLSATQIRLGGSITLTNVIVVNSQTLKVDIPPSVNPGTYDINIVNPDGQQGVLQDGLEVKREVKREIFLPIISVPSN